MFLDRIREKVETITSYKKYAFNFFRHPARFHLNVSEVYDGGSRFKFALIDAMSDERQGALLARL